ncbi:MAG: hypothetical protein NC336_01690 [Clostridium sp.]|nr:hypothetical protein [Clostridium sp.]
MITKKVIEEIYRKYNKRPDSPFDLNLGLLFEYAADNHGINLDEEKVVINSIEPDSIFHSINLNHIHEIVEFENAIAIVLHSSIIFLNKHDNKSYIHIRTDRPGFFDRILSRFSSD